MVTSLIGTHGTGKTTVFRELKQARPDWQFLPSPTRHQMKAFKYNDPYKLVDTIGVGQFQLMNMNAWSILDPQVNTALDITKPVITDRSAVDNFAYYLRLREFFSDFRLDCLLTEMARHYISLIDRFIVFPMGVFPLPDDRTIRRLHLSLQKDVDHKIKEVLEKFQVSSDKIYHLQSINVKDRVREILALLD